MVYSPGDESYHLGTITITKGEYATAEKVNQIIDWMRDHERRIGDEEGK